MVSTEPFSPNPNEAAYDSIADQWARARATADVPDTVIELTRRMTAGQRVLDIGCGSGLPVTRHLVDSGLVVTGIDVSERLLARARRNVPEARLRRADVMTYDDRAEFDGIVAWDSLFHLRPHEHAGAFDKIHRLLRPGGYVAFTHGGSEGEITGTMFEQTFNYSSPGPSRLRETLRRLAFAIVDWQLDESGNGYLAVLARKSPAT